MRSLQAVESPPGIAPVGLSSVPLGWRHLAHHLETVVTIRHGKTWQDMARLRSWNASLENLQKLPEHLEESRCADFFAAPAQPSSLRAGIQREQSISGRTLERWNGHPQKILWKIEKHTIFMIMKRAMERYDYELWTMNNEHIDFI